MMTDLTLLEMFWTGSVSAMMPQAGHSTCRGDSGGPLATLADVQHDIWEMVGVVSFGVPRCGSVVAPLVFTRWVVTW